MACIAVPPAPGPSMAWSWNLVASVGLAIVICTLGMIACLVAIRDSSAHRLRRSVLGVSVCALVAAFMGVEIRVSIVPHWFASIESWYTSNFNVLVRGRCSIGTLVTLHRTALAREYLWQVLGDILLSVGVVVFLLAYTYLWAMRIRPTREAMPQ